MTHLSALMTLVSPSTLAPLSLVLAPPPAPPTTCCSVTGPPGYRMGAEPSYSVLDTAYSHTVCNNTFSGDLGLV